MRALTTTIADPASNGLGLAGAILAGMILALVYAGVAVWRGSHHSSSSPGRPLLRYAIPLLAVTGLGVAGYLSFVEVWSVPPVCGPIGDCTRVQNSPYARLLGIPIGILGLAGYVIILGAWLWQTRAASYAGQMPLVIFCAALFGVFFSIYLTWVELFVLRAVCIWCLASAVLVTLILLFSIGPLLRASATTDS
jgi:uncharacterized membrane protein